MNRGTVIYFGGFSLPDKNAAANRVVSNGKLFETLGYKTVFLGTSYDEECFDGIKKVSEEIDMYEEAHPVSSASWLKHLLNIENLKAIVGRYENVKMIILYNMPVVTLFIVKKAFKNSGIKIIYDCTEWTKDTDGSFLKRAFKSADEFFVRHFAHRLSDGMIVISRMMESAYKSNKNLLKLPPLVDINDEIWHQLPEKEKDIFEFCFAGIPDGKKESLDKVVEAFSLLPVDFARLRIVGVTAEEFKSLYPEMSISADIRNKIHFMGRVPHSAAVKYILGCDCYMFIRGSDRRNNAGFPTKFAESFTCAVPVITTDVSDVGEYIRKSGRGAVLNAPCTKEIADAMLAQMKNGALTGKRPDKTFHYETYKEACERWFEAL